MEYYHKFINQRVKRLEVSCKLIETVLTTGTKIPHDTIKQIEIAEGIPDKAELCGAEYIFRRKVVRLYFFSEDFPKYTNSEILPECINIRQKAYSHE